MLNKNTCNNRCIYFSSATAGRRQSLSTREFAQGISCLSEQIVTLDPLTLQVSSALLTLIHDACWEHTAASSRWPTVEGDDATETLVGLGRNNNLNSYLNIAHPHYFRNRTIMTFMLHPRRSMRTWWQQWTVALSRFTAFS